MRMLTIAGAAALAYRRFPGGGPRWGCGVSAGEWLGCGRRAGRASWGRPAGVRFGGGTYE